MKHRVRLTIASLIYLLSCCGAAGAQGLVVITNPDVRLSLEDVREVFLGEKQIANDVRLVPVDNASAQSAFLARVVRLDPNKYSAAWIKKSFRDGLNPPQMKANDAEVAEFVRRVPGAVGYVTSPPDGGVNVVKLP